MPDDNRLSSYLFTVEIEGVETARFQKCEGLEAETYVYEIEEGGLNTSTHKFYGRTRFPNIILEKGISGNNSLYNWYKETVLEDRKIERKNGSIVLKDNENNEVKRWNFFRAFPCRWIGPRLETNLGSEYAVERIELAHEGIVVD
jgi:phage tail-like protein